MGQDIPSYTPIALPFVDYDSLAAMIGTDVTSGTPWLDWLPFNQITIAIHDPASALFNQPDTVYYCQGPHTAGSLTHPFLYEWTSWVATESVRIGQIGAVTPPANNLGQVSGLYPLQTPAKISHAFNDEGLLAMAIPSISGGSHFTDITRYVDNDGNTATSTFSGQSCVLFNNSLLDSSMPSQSGIIAFYLRPEFPNQLFGRFEMDDPSYSQEHILMPSLRSAPERLISVEGFKGRQILRYIDTLGRDCTLTSPVYSQVINIENKLGNSTALASGFVFVSGIYAAASTLTDNARIFVELSSGVIYDATVPPSTAPFSDNANVTVNLDSGEVN